MKFLNVSEWIYTLGQLFYYWIILVILMIVTAIITITTYRRFSNKQQKALDFREDYKYLALQNQINPHFLYNTLEGIRSESLRGGLDGVAKMSELLALFFRYNSTHLDQLVTIDEELNNLEIYLEIQKFRFNKRIHLVKHFEANEEDVLALKIPKLVLQPIIENAIQHGLEPLIRAGTIELRFELLENFLAITISDDGVGIDWEQVKELNNRMNNYSIGDENIGLQNVNKRIQWLFGEDYGLYFYSKVNVGTDVVITLPVRSIL